MRVVEVGARLRRQRRDGEGNKGIRVHLRYLIFDTTNLFSVPRRRSLEEGLGEVLQHSVKTTLEND